MLIDLYLKGREVVIFGGGNEAELKMVKAFDDGVQITVLSKEFTSKMAQFAHEGKIRLVKYDLEKGFSKLKNFIKKPFVVFLATDNPKLNRQGRDFAKKLGAIVYVVDTPELCDFVSPGVAKIGEMRVGISTGGKSPVIAKLLRQRIESSITEEDLLQLELQEYARKKVRPRINEFSSRKKFLWQVVEDDQIKSLIKKHEMQQAKALVDLMIERVI